MYGNSYGDYSYYRCQESKRTNSCNRESIRVKKVEKAFFNKLREEITDDLLKEIETIRYNEKLDKLDEKENTLSNQIDNLKDRLDNLYGALERKVITDEEFIERKSTLESKINSTEKELKQLRKEQRKYPTEEKNKRYHFPF